MTLIKSISGFRGTIGGSVGDNLTPIDIVENTAAFGQWVLNKATGKASIVIGRDGRNTGKIVSDLVTGTLLSMGIDVIDTGLTTTPTLEMYVRKVNADGGIIFSASHNPMNWNALKLLNSEGEFISKSDGEELLQLIVDRKIDFVDYASIGKLTNSTDSIDYHISRVLEHPWVLKDEIRKKKFTIVVDCINSTGSISLIPLLEKLHCHVIAINDDISGKFSHDPEPLEKNLSELIQTVVRENADLGISVDPDVDRVAFIREDGKMFGEEYTIVAIAQYLLHKNLITNTVSNLSSTRALSDITNKFNQKYHASAVGEVNVVEMMKKQKSLFGGEGNGGVIVPELHYGRDALIGTALFLSGMVHFDITPSDWKQKLPQYEMAKEKVKLVKGINPDDILKKLEREYQSERLNTIDGLKIEFEDHWVHMRKSNTEPIIRIYTEGKSKDKAQAVADKFKQKIMSFVK
ncbi:phosphoglucosamine mutase [Membranihabitans maritimus]|uniref:phosphoglucosamine mutase n=1 Tax=Membranihabitans maritimus TaxID=2904244 RepID=UPI001F000E36